MQTNIVITTQSPSLHNNVDTALILIIIKASVHRFGTLCWQARTCPTTQITVGCRPQREGRQAPGLSINLMNRAYTIHLCSAASVKKKWVDAVDGQRAVADHQTSSRPSQPEGGGEVQIEKRSGRTAFTLENKWVDVVHPGRRPPPSPTLAALVNSQDAN